MARPQTLNEISHLTNSGFGRPKPRHGLKLLFWFANKCIDFDGNNNMKWRYDPEDGDLGFHLFENRYMNDGVKLLPDVSYSYYELGNLLKPGAKELPHYIWEDFTGHHDISNRDRIIVSVDDEWFDKVYVTEHKGQTNYNPDATFCISKGLLMNIQKLSLDEFLADVGY